MADIRDITVGSTYTGSAQLGGGLAAKLVTDPSPLQRLSTFQYYRDRDLWQQKVQDDKDAALKLADITGYDPTSRFKPFNDDLKAQLSDIQTYVRDNPDALVYGRNPEKYTALQEKINSFQNKRKAATANDILYTSAKNEVEKIGDPIKRELRRRELESKADGLFKNGLDGAYNNLIDSLPELKQDDYQIPTVGATSRSFLTIDPNNNIETTVTYLDPEDGIAKAELTAATPAGSLDESLQGFQNLSPEEQKLEREKAALTGETRRAMQKTSNDFNSMLQQWQQANPGVDINTVDPNSLPDGTLENNIKSAIAINKQIDELNSFIAQGKIKDNFGVVRKTPYAKINLADGLSEAEVIWMTSLQRQGNALIQKVQKDATYTGDQTRREGQQLDYQAAWARRSNPTGDKLLDAIENPARNFGDHVDRVKKWYKEHPNSGPMLVTYKALNDDTFKALGLDPKLRIKDDVFVQYNEDGSYRTSVKAKTYEDNKTKKRTTTITEVGQPGTIEQLQKGFIDVTKSGDADKGGVQSEGFQTNAENGFYKIFGTNDVRAIWDNWGKVSNRAAPTSAGTVVPGTGGGGSSSSGGYTNVKRATVNGKPANIGVRDGKWYNIDTGQEIK